jgi:hypothetical protein
LGILENRVLRRIYGLKREEVIGQKVIRQNCMRMKIAVFWVVAPCSLP